MSRVCQFTLLSMACVATMVLSGCSSSDQPDLRAWMVAERSSVRPKLQPISEPTRFQPQNYTVADTLDPFANEKLEAVLRGAQAGGEARSALLEAELNRRKEPLEDYPLDAMKMVGSLTRQGQPVALLKVNNLLYQVKTGNYIGQNYGRVQKISESEIVLREVVQDPGGEWVERPATLLLQEESSK